MEQWQLVGGSISWSAARAQLCREPVSLPQHSNPHSTAQQAPTTPATAPSTATPQSCRPPQPPHSNPHSCAGPHTSNPHPCLLPPHAVPFDGRQIPCLWRTWLCEHPNRREGMHRPIISVHEGRGLAAAHRAGGHTAERSLGDPHLSGLTPPLSGVIPTLWLTA